MGAHRIRFAPMGYNMATSFNSVSVYASLFNYRMALATCPGLPESTQPSCVRLEQIASAAVPHYDSVFSRRIKFS